MARARPPTRDAISRDDLALAVERAMDPSGEHWACSSKARAEKFADALLAEFSIVARGDTPPAPTDEVRTLLALLAGEGVTVTVWPNIEESEDWRVEVHRPGLSRVLYAPSVAAALAEGCALYGLEVPTLGPRGVTPDPQTALDALATEMRSNSERWFPGWHAPDAPVPLHIAWALGLAGEVGEVANVVKKLIRDGESDEQRHNLGAELADVFVYLLLLAQECDVDLVSEYRTKVVVNELRWNARAAVGDRPPTPAGASGSYKIVDPQETQKKETRP